ncbi:MAG: hypothetical protein RLZZ200_387 [Pseudomonadota bacterium]|jgi:uncharacterized protein YndB with AHSA1/START domain
MTSARFPPAPDATLDLSFERLVPLSPDRIWAAWTQPELIVQWFTPVPWRTVEANVDLRPGGEFFTVMQSPEGQQFPNAGCYLDVVPNERLVWTNAMRPGFRPVPTPAGGSVDFLFTACIDLAPVEGGTRYRATVVHADAESCTRHREMGFEQGWGAALDQLVALMKGRG